LWVEQHQRVGIRETRDLVEHVVACRDAGADGVVVGRALLSGAVTLRDALAAAASSSS